MIIANILRHPDETDGRMDGDGWKNIKMSDLLGVEIDGEERTAIQWAFKSTEAQRQFDEHCHGKVTQYNLYRLSIAEAAAAAQSSDGHVGFAASVEPGDTGPFAAATPAVPIHPYDNGE
ncbi:hypothetical protein TWF281_011045 [Arthrobotrys megalospora]